MQESNSLVGYVQEEDDDDDIEGWKVPGAFTIEEDESIVDEDFGIKEEEAWEEEELAEMDKEDDECLTLTHGSFGNPFGLSELHRDWARTAGGPNEEPPAKCAIYSPPPVYLQSSPHGLIYMEFPGGSGLHKDSIRMELIIAHPWALIVLWAK